MHSKQALSVRSLLQSFGGNEPDEAAIERVIACTNELVNLALQANWSGVLDGMDERRRLLQDVIDSGQGHFNPKVAALTAAVEESERALMRVVAHAIASSRWNGAVFMLHH